MSGTRGDARKRLGHPANPYARAVPVTEDRRTRTEILTDEILRLRQGLWDVYRELGFDTDGQPTPAALAFPDVVTLVVEAAKGARRDYDEALSDLPNAVDVVKAAGYRVVRLEPWDIASVPLLPVAVTEEL